MNTIRIQSEFLKKDLQDFPWEPHLLKLQL